jgi:hypothetical protein
MAPYMDGTLRCKWGRNMRKIEKQFVQVKLSMNHMAIKWGLIKSSYFHVCSQKSNFHNMSVKYGELIRETKLPSPNPRYTSRHLKATIDH